MFFRSSLAVAALSLVFASTGVPARSAASQPAEVAAMTLLHTNDIHDVMLPPKISDIGGMAYVSGFIHSIKDGRDDVLVLDAGDALQKGDYMCVVSKGEVSYRAMGLAGIDVTVPGNHDFAYGLEALQRNVELAGLSMICAGLTDEKSGKLFFEPCVIRQVGKVKVAVIGGMVDWHNGRYGNYGRVTKPIAALAEEVGALARKLEGEVDLTVFLYHEGTKAGKQVAAKVPELDVVVCGHSNELLEQPLKVPGGAMILEAGRGAEHVGVLDLKVDRTANIIVDYTYELAKMDHKAISPDERLQAQIEAWDRQYVPEDAQPLCVLGEDLAGPERFDWFGKAMIAGTGADLALLDAIMFQQGAAAGPLTLNDLYMMLTPRFDTPVSVFSVSGKQLKQLLAFHSDSKKRDYVVGLPSTPASQPATMQALGEAIEDDRQYKVAVTRICLDDLQSSSGIASLLKEMQAPLEERKEKVLDLAVTYAKSERR